MKYLVSESKNINGVSLLLEKAVIKRSGTPLLLGAMITGNAESDKGMLRDLGAWFQNDVVGNLINLLAAKKYSPDEVYSLTEEYFSSMCHSLQGKWPVDQSFTGVCTADGHGSSSASKLSVIFCIDDNAFISGDEAYIIQDQFGKKTASSALSLENEAVKLTSGATLLLAGGPDCAAGEKSVTGPDCATGEKPATGHEFAAGDKSATGSECAAGEAPAAGQAGCTRIVDDRDCIECLAFADSEDSLTRAVREISFVHPSAVICIKACE